MGGVGGGAWLGRRARRRGRRAFRCTGRRCAGRDRQEASARRHPPRHPRRRDPDRAPPRGRAAQRRPVAVQDPERIHLADRTTQRPDGDRRRQRRRSSRARFCHRAWSVVSADAERWDRDLDERASPAPLLQSWAWGEVQARAGWSTERIQLSPEGAMASVQLRKVGPAREAYVPRGPVPATAESLEQLVDLLPWCRTYTAYTREKRQPLATVLVARHAGRAYSLFAGRSGAHRELMGNDLAWWSAISSAAEAGCNDFDLWGVPPPRSGP